MLLGTFGTSKLLGNLLTGKGTINAGENIIRGGHNFWCCQIEPKFNGVNSKNKLLEIKDRANVINLDKFKSIGTHWTALCVNGNNRRLLP